MTDQCNSNMYGHQHECSCGCGSESGCKCGCGSHHHHHHDNENECHCAEKFLRIADDAWIEVLKDKIKEKIIAKKGDHIDKLAEMVATANGEKWKHVISAKTKCHKFKDNLKEFFSSCDE